MSHHKLNEMSDAQKRADDLCRRMSTGGKHYKDESGLNESAGGALVEPPRTARAPAPKPAPRPLSKPRPKGR